MHYKFLVVVFWGFYAYDSWSQDNDAEAVVKKQPVVETPDLTFGKALGLFEGDWEEGEWGDGVETYEVAGMAGYTADGVLFDKGQATVTLNISPCQDEVRLVTFIRPYIESDIDDVECHGETHDRIQVIQLDESWPAF